MRKFVCQRVLKNAYLIHLGTGSKPDIERQDISAHEIIGELCKNKELSDQ